MESRACAIGGFPSANLGYTLYLQMFDPQKIPARQGFFVQRRLTSNMTRCTTTLLSL